MRLAILPSDILVQHVLSWLELAEICLLDSACCNKAHRPGWLADLQTLSTEERPVVVMPSVWCWMIARGLPVTSLDADQLLNKATEEQQNVMERYLIKYGDVVKDIKIAKADLLISNVTSSFQERLIELLLLHCAQSNLHFQDMNVDWARLQKFAEFKIASCRYKTDSSSAFCSELGQVATTIQVEGNKNWPIIVSSCTNLKQLILSYFKVAAEDLGSIFNNNPQLTALDWESDEYPNRVLSACHYSILHLQSFKLTGPRSWNVSAFLPLAQRSPHMKHIKLSYFETSQQDLRTLFACWPGLTHIELFSCHYQMNEDEQCVAGAFAFLADCCVQLQSLCLWFIYWEQSHSTTSKRRRIQDVKGSLGLTSIAEKCKRLNCIVVDSLYCEKDWNSFLRICGPRLKSLNLPNWGKQDPLLAFLPHCPLLEYLGIFRDWTDEDCMNIAPLCVNLKFVQLGDAKGLSDVGLKALLMLCPSLRHPSPSHLREYDGEIFGSGTAPLRVYGGKGELDSSALAVQLVTRGVLEMY